MRLGHLATGLVLCAMVVVVPESASAETGAGADFRTGTAANYQTSAEVDAYWTPERRRNAKPAPIPAPAASKGRPEPRGNPITIPGRASDGPAIQGTIETTGRLWFTANGTDYICTATVVTSNNKSVIATARHCGFGSGGTNYSYAPNFSGGNAPHGWWNWVWATWPVGGDGITNDYAFIVLERKNGSPVSHVVGSNGIAFGYAINQFVTVFGIPGATNVVSSCSGNAHTGPQGQQLLNCGPLTGGASGGSWNVDSQPGTWAYQTGTYFGTLNSEMAGSYFGEFAHTLWNNAQNY